MGAKRELVCSQVVTWHDRGRLAKVLLLLLSLTVSLSKANVIDALTSCHCLTVWELVIDQLGYHPLALQWSQGQLKALAEFAASLCWDGDALEGLVEGTISPSLCELLFAGKRTRNRNQQ